MKINRKTMFSNMNDIMDLASDIAKEIKEHTFSGTIDYEEFIGLDCTYYDAIFEWELDTVNGQYVVSFNSASGFVDEDNLTEEHEVSLNLKDLNERVNKKLNSENF